MLTADKTTIVDGRNRYRACMAMMVDPVFRTLPASFTEEQVVDFIVSENLRRRHLNAGQLAFMALKVEEHFAELARQRQAEAARRAAEIGNRSRHNLPASTDSNRQVPADLPEPQHRRQREASEQAARTVGASGRAVRQAKRVDKEAPELAEQVRAGKLALDAAEREVRRRLAERKRIEPEPERPKPHRAEPIMLTLRTHTGDEVPYPKPTSKPTFNATSGPGISWADWSWNPVTGCLHGCKYCYAREIATNDRYASAYPRCWRCCGTRRRSGNL